MKKITKLVFNLCLLGGALSLNAQDYALTPLDLTVEQGATADLTVCMTNGSLDVVSLQFDVYLPDGVTVAVNDYDQPLADHVADRVADHIVQGAVQDNGAVRFLSYSPTNLVYKGSEGALLNIPLVINLEPGEYTVTIKDGSLTHAGDFEEFFTPNATAKLTVTEPVVKRYGENQLYALDVTVNAGENCVLEIGYNSTSEVYEYAATIILPDGVEPVSVAFTEAVEVTNFTNDWDFTAPKLNVKGEYGGGRRDVPAEAGDIIIARASLNTASLAPGKYTIVVTDQFVSNDDDDWAPEAYEAILTVVGGTAPLEQCEAPELAIDGNGNIVATCATEGATIHTTIAVDDHKTVHHASGDVVELTGRYLVTSYATAEGKLDSDPVTASIIWAKGPDVTSEDELITATERSLLVYNNGDRIVISGLSNGETIAIYDFNGISLYRDAATGCTMEIPVSVEKGKVYIVHVGKHVFKYIF